jgi:hypothetical protein
MSFDYGWIEDAIDKKFFKSYVYEKFINFREIGYGSFGKVESADYVDYDCENLNQCYALKSFHRFDDITLKAIVHEVMQVW